MRLLRRLARAILLLGGALRAEGMADPPMELSVEGATGANARLVNGLYELSPKAEGAPGCYKNGEISLCDRDGGWWILQVGRGDIYYSEGTDLPPTGVWKECQTGAAKASWPTVSTLKVTSLGAATSSPARSLSGKAPQDESVDVSGVPTTATSNGHLVNGRYIPTTVEKNGADCYRKADGTNFWMCMDNVGNWLVQPKEDLGKKKGYIMGTKKLAKHVWESGPFRLYNGKKFLPTPAIQVAARSASAAKVSWTAALTAIAALVTVVVTLGCTLSNNPRLRGYMYRYISCTMTIFVAVFAVQAVWVAAFAKTTPMIAGIVGFSFFSFCYLSLVILGWKFQYSHPRLYGLKTLCSNITAFIGIFTFTVIQRECIRELPSQLQSSVVSKTAAQMITAVGVLLFTWLVLAAYREMGVGIRVERLNKAPSLPWGSKLTKATTSPAKRNCASIIKTTTKVVTTTMDILPDWVAMVEEAEEVVAQLIMSFVINQTAVFLLTKEIPGLEGEYNKDHIAYWWGVMAVFTIVAAALIACRTKAGEGSRAGRVLQLSMALAASWSMFRLAHSYLQGMYPSNVALSQFVSACVISCVSILLMFLFDILFDKAAGRISALPKTTSSGHDSIYSMQYTLALCFGVISGLAWHETFTFGVDTLVEGTKFLSTMPRLSELVISLIIAVLVARGWWTSVLPKAEMTEPAHDRLIQLEQELSVYPHSFT